MSRPIWAAKRKKNEVYIKNGSFENAPVLTAAQNPTQAWINGTTGGSTTENRYGWYMQGVGGKAQFDNAVYFEGTTSMQLYNTQPGVDLAVVNYPGGTNLKGYCPELKPNNMYMFEFYMKTLYLDGNTQAGNGALIQALLRKAAGGLWSTGSISIAGENLTTSSTSYVTDTRDWQRYSGTFTTPDDPLGEVIYFAPKLCIFNTTGSAKDLLMKARFDALRLFDLGSSIVVS